MRRLWCILRGYHMIIDVDPEDGTIADQYCVTCRRYYVSAETQEVLGD